MAARYEVVVEIEGQPAEWRDYGDKAERARDVYAAYCQRGWRPGSKVVAVFLLKDGIVVASDDRRDIAKPGGCGAMRFPKFFSIDDAKAVKAQSETKDWLNAINYMAPAETAGVGNARMLRLAVRRSALGRRAAMRREGEDNAVTRSRKAKAVYYMRERRAFMAELVVHIHRALVRAEREGRRLCVRLNGSTDVAWESASVEGERLMGLFPTVQFVDYTKSVRRMMRSLTDPTWPANYYLTFSRSEDNAAECEAVLAAVVFGAGVPSEYMGAVDGDKHDLRHERGAGGVVVGLTPKGLKAKRDRTGFVLRNAVV